MLFNLKLRFWVYSKIPAEVQLHAFVQVEASSHNSSHSSKSSSCREAQFWSSVPPGLVERLGEPWAYGPDLLMFQYTAGQYFRDIKEKCQTVTT